MLREMISYEKFSHNLTFEIQIVGKILAFNFIDSWVSKTFH